MKKLLLVLCGVLLQNHSNATARNIAVNDEIKNASFVGEVIIRSYGIENECDVAYDKSSKSMRITDRVVQYVRSIQYSLLNDPNTILTLHQNNFISPFDTYFDTVHTNRICDEGYYPHVGDRVLMVLNKNSQLSLFAEVHKNFYRFWSPVVTSSRFTVFFYKLPFIEYEDYHAIKRNYKFYDERKEYSLRVAPEGYDEVSLFYCIVNKQYLRMLQGNHII